LLVAKPRHPLHFTFLIHENLITTRGGPILDIKDIKTVIELMKRNDLTHFELERESFKLVLKKNADPEAIAAMLAAGRSIAMPTLMAATVPTPAAGPVAVAATVLDPAPAAEENGGAEIKSPMVGTFYRSPGPGQDVFVKVGDYVEADTTVCIIEAMKVMNEIKAETSGRISRLLVEDATPVAYGQALFEVKP
jgi:acetyl-CoA carboxylase biotin carboxyl carrier protein